MKSFGQRSMILRLAVLLSSLVALSFGALSWQQVDREYRFGIEDLDRRARTTAHRMAPAALEALREEAEPVGRQNLRSGRVPSGY